MQMMLLGTEQLRVVYTDNQNKIIADEVLSYGVEDQTAVYPRMIVRKCLEHYATGAIVVDNHPTGQLRPSNADIQITRAIAGALLALDLRFLDHIIIGSEEKRIFQLQGKRNDITQSNGRRPGNAAKTGYKPGKRK